MVSTFDIPVFGNFGRGRLKIGTAEFIDNGLQMRLEGVIIDDLQRFAEGGVLDHFEVTYAVVGAEPGVPPKKFEYDEPVAVTEPRHLYFGKKGKIIGVMEDHYRVMFLDTPGYSMFVEWELSSLKENKK